MKFKWAVLNVLAKWPDRRVTFAEIRRQVGSILETGDRWLAGFFAAAATKAQSLAGLWRAHVVHDTSNPKTQRATGSVLGAMLAFLGLAAVFACAAAALALVQLKSLKTEIATLHRELGPLKERVAKLEQAEKTNWRQIKRRVVKSNLAPKKIRLEPNQVPIKVP